MASLLEKVETEHGGCRTLAGEMNVTVRYFAAAAEAAGCEEEDLLLEHGATLGSLRSLLEARYGEPMRHVMRTGSFLIDRVVRRDNAFPLSARVDVLPPFAGG
jgi:molybdopterin synthase sulfur carrier subunit